MTTTTTKGKAAVALAVLAAVAAGLLAYFLLRGGPAAPEGAPADPYDEPYARLKDADTLNKLGAMVCMECGSCAWSCPGGKPLVQYMRLAKEVMRQAGVK